MAHRIIDFYTREEIPFTEETRIANLNQWNEFDSADEALTHMITHKNEGNITLGDILYEIEKTWKPLEVGGLKMSGHYVWNNHVFFMLSRFCSYVGELKM